MLFKTSYRQYLLTICLICGSLGSFEASEEVNLPANELLRVLRHPSILECWAKLKGNVKHKSPSASLSKIPIEICARLTPKEITSQLIFNGSERYLIRQELGNRKSDTKVICQKSAHKKDIALADVGLRPNDITLSFLYWNFNKELGKDKVRGQPCRVLQLSNPIKPSEFIHIWVSEQYIFPIRVQWFKAENQDPFRALEFTGFQKVNGIWIIKELKIKGPDWKSLVKLRDNVVELITPTHPVPDDLFIESEN